MEMIMASGGNASGDQLRAHEPIADSSARDRQQLEQVTDTSLLDLQDHLCEVCNKLGTGLQEFIAEKAWLKELLTSERERTQSYEARIKQLLSDLYASRQEVIRVKSNMEEALVANNSEIEALKKQLAQSESDLASAKVENSLLTQKLEKTNQAIQEEAVVLKDQSKDGDCNNPLCDLPNKDLLRILSALPLKDAVRTSVLCKRWGHLWALTPDLRFMESDFSEKSLFLDFMEKACALRGGSAIRVFSLSCYQDSFSTLMKKLFSSFVSCGVQELSLTLDSDREVSEFPPSVFECGTLLTLKVQASCIFKLPSSFCLSNLKVLILQRVVFEHKDSVEKLFSLFLERLEIRDCEWSINSPSCDSQVQINGGSLKFFHYRGGFIHELCISGDTTHLVEVTLLPSSSLRQGVKLLLLSTFSTVKELTLTDSLVKGLAETSIPLFSNLIKLTINDEHVAFTTEERVKSLWAVLRWCPRLRSLYFVRGDAYCLGYTKAVWLDQVPSYFLSELKEVSFLVDSWWCDWPEHSVVGIFLEKAVALEKLVVLCNRTFTLSESLLKYLNGFRVKSKKCRILVQPQN